MNAEATLSNAWGEHLIVLAVFAFYCRMTGCCLHWINSLIEGHEMLIVLSGIDTALISTVQAVSMIINRFLPNE
ncbi:hypothetical protein [Pseudomonas thivervalensis]|uniref:hypothetical protein n=1 Tax=Pseudomonas thivervalensis TaxID=86265 RepID=UPI003CEB040B